MKLSTKEYLNLMKGYVRLVRAGEWVPAENVKREIRRRMGRSENEEANTSVRSSLTGFVTKLALPSDDVLNNLLQSVAHNRASRARDQKEFSQIFFDIEEQNQCATLIGIDLQHDRDTALIDLQHTIDSWKKPQKPPSSKDSGVLADWK